jgi:hypothetical protein
MVTNIPIRVVVPAERVCGVPIPRIVRELQRIGQPYMLFVVLVEVATEI